MHIKTALLILASASVAAAQDVPQTPLDSNTTASAEQAALRFALDSAAVKPGRVVVSPNLAINATAPGRGDALRPIWRTDLLASYLKGTSKVRDSVISCASRTSMGPRCDFIGADTFVTLSDPRFDGGLATVTVTIEQPGSRGGVFYRTYNVVMSNTSAGWKLLKMELLGIS